MATAVAFKGVVTGGTDATVRYSVLEPNGGEITAAGNYLAPLTTGVYHVRATSVIDPTRFAEATVSVRGYHGRIERLATPSDGYDSFAAIQLEDGSILISGGRGLSGVHRQAELYVPDEDRFQLVGSMAIKRMSHIMFSLPNGTVVAAGGYDITSGAGTFDPVYRSSEIYDHRTRQWTSGPEMTVPRRNHVWTTLDDATGRILITGGIQLYGNGFGASVNTEFFDPSSMQFTPGPEMKTGRWLHTMTRLNDGRVLVVGGRSNNCTGRCDVFSLSTAELYDPVTNTFRSTGSLHISRYNHTATLLDDGRVLILGGESTEDLGTGTDQVADIEIYDPVTESFSRAGMLHSGRGSHTATVLNDRRILLAGGERISGIPTTSTEIYDPHKQTSVDGPDLIEHHVRAQAFRNSMTGDVIVLAGSNSYQPVQVAEVFR
ncbi:MAG TPA: kelch repeat-containing protein [Edaphobacter sp.]|nr:kelch repeat-containing protein [Edaphobacter sp.]